MANRIICWLEGHEFSMGGSVHFHFFFSPFPFFCNGVSVIERQPRTIPPRHKRQILLSKQNIFIGFRRHSLTAGLDTLSFFTVTSAEAKGRFVMWRTHEEQN